MNVVSHAKAIAANAQLWGHKIGGARELALDVAPKHVAADGGASARELGAARQRFFALGQTPEAHANAAAAKTRADVLDKGGSLEEANRLAALVGGTTDAARPAAIADARMSSAQVDHQRMKLARMLGA